MALLTGLTADGTEVPVQVKPDGALVAEGLEGPAGPAGPPGATGPAGSSRFGNILINGNLLINQRELDVASVAVGEYGQDRWKKTAGGMTQIIEESSFEPGATYTLSGTGVTTQQLTAPASGHWTLPDIPVTARKIQLELGSVATPFEHRPISVEMALCERYYRKGSVRFWGEVTDAQIYVVQDSFPAMSKAPIATFTATLGGAENRSLFPNHTHADSIIRDTTPISVAGQAKSIGTGTGRYWYEYSADAEL